MATPGEMEDEEIYNAVKNGGEQFINSLSEDEAAEMEAAFARHEQRIASQKPAVQQQTAPIKSPQEIADEKMYNRVQIEGPRFMNSMPDEQAIEAEMAVKRHKARLNPQPQASSSKPSMTMEAAPSNVPMTGENPRIRNDVDPNSIGGKVRAFVGSAVPVLPYIQDALETLGSDNQFGVGPQPYDIETSQANPNSVVNQYKRAVGENPVSSVAGMVAAPGNFATKELGVPLAMGLNAAKGGVEFGSQADLQGVTPEQGVAGGAFGGAVGVPVGSAIGAGISKIVSKLDDVIVKKLGPAALKWVNEYAEKIALRGTNASSPDIQALRKAPSKMGLDSALDDIKYSLVNELRPGVLDDATKTAQDLSNLVQKTKVPFDQQVAASAARDAEIANAKATNESISMMNDQYIRPAREGVISDLNKGKQMKVPKFPIEDRPLVPVPEPISVDPKLADQYERVSALEGLMSPGVNSQISKIPSGGLATTPTGAAANTLIDRAAKVKNVALLNTANSIAKRALNSVKNQAGVDLATAPFKREDTIRKLMTISQMPEQEAAAYAYAESMSDPIFRQAWLDAQKKKEDE